MHNGIEYADMQMIAEIYGIMRDGLAFEAEEVAMAFEAWNRGPLKSYLIEITGEVARATDPETGLPVIDIILDRAGQKGTGRWTAIEAQHLGAPATTIEAAVAARNISARIEERAAGAERFGFASRAVPDEPQLIDRLQEALLAGKIACYAQGFGLLAAASEEFGWSLPMAGIARVWRAGCIIRSALLDDMAQALEGGRRANLMFAPRFAEMLTADPRQPARRGRPGRARRHPHPGAGGGARLFRHDADRGAPPPTCCRRSATSSARTASSGSTAPAPSTAPGAATPRSRRHRQQPPALNRACDPDHSPPRPNWTMVSPPDAPRGRTRSRTPP